MKITFLGTAAATSYPLPFCKCNNCKTARSMKGKNIRKRSSLLIDEKILIDMGPDFVTSLNMYDKDITKLKYLLQTHAHSDHFDAGHFVTRWSEYATINPPHMTIYAHPKCLEAMSNMIRCNEDIDIFNASHQQDLNITLTTIQHLENIRFENYSLTAIESMHDSQYGSLLYMIENNDSKLLYATDTTTLSDSALNLLENQQLDCLILDHTYGEVLNCSGHLNEKQFRKEIYKLKQINAITNSTRIFATHISHEGCPIHSEMEKIANGLYEIAYDGLEINI